MLLIILLEIICYDLSHSYSKWYKFVLVTYDQGGSYMLSYLNYKPTFLKIKHNFVFVQKYFTREAYLRILLSKQCYFL